MPAPIPPLKILRVSKGILNAATFAGGIRFMGCWYEYDRRTDTLTRKDAVRTTKKLALASIEVTA